MALPRSLQHTSLFDYPASVRTHLHRFLLMLLMLVLPLQTLAAASMLDCALSHQGGVEPLPMADDMMAGCHETEPSDAPPAEHNCTHCAACVLASAMPMRITDRLPITPAPQRFTPQPAASFAGFIPEGPERPPRAPLA